MRVDKLAAVPLRSVGILLRFCLLSATLVSTADGQEWPKRMFEKLEHDFGTVARGSDTVYKFKITNPYVEELHVASVRSSCGCTSPSIENEHIKTWESGYIVAKFNTRSQFTGIHSATLTVTFDKPYPAQIQLRVHGNIRGDVVFEPGKVNFGEVDQGAASEQTITVSHAGRHGWSIQDVVTSDSVSDYYEVQLAEQQRSGSRVQYDLTVRLKESTPAGYIQDQLVLITNDASNPRIPLVLQGRVIPEISVAPANLVLGEVAPGNKVPKKLVVRGKKDFKITRIECDDSCFEVEYDDQARKTHVVSLRFCAGENSGQLKEIIRVHTDLGDTYTATCTAYATIVAPPAVEDQGAVSQEGASTVKNISTASHNNLAGN